MFAYTVQVIFLKIIWNSNVYLKNTLLYKHLFQSLSLYHYLNNIDSSTFFITFVFIDPMALSVRCTFDSQLFDCIYFIYKIYFILYLSITYWLFSILLIHQNDNNCRTNAAKMSIGNTIVFVLNIYFPISYNIFQIRPEKYFICIKI